ncbi:MAG TPA: hypothetical protein ENO07_03960, partial [candidate division Zixibacteria bacterium]|nr:hypothetical protein [candidate division Zixibacteria bacterium]
MKKGNETIYVFLVAILLIPLSLFASRDFEPVFKPDLAIAKLTESIKIDGKLDDRQWAMASQITQFHERHPRELAEPEVSTRALLAYDEDNLY